MSEPGEIIQTYCFAGPVQSENDLANIHRYMGRRNLYPLAEFEAYNPVLDNEADNYYVETMPTSTESFMDKAHVWKIADEIDLSRRIASEIFDRLVYPVLGQATRSTRPRVVDPASIGITVANRNDVGLPKLPKGIIIQRTNERFQLHRRDPRGLKIAPHEVVLQAGGIIRKGEEDAIQRMRSMGDTKEQFDRNFLLFAGGLRTHIDWSKE